MWTVRDAAQRPRMKLMSPADIWLFTMVEEVSKFELEVILYRFQL